MDGKTYDIVVLPSGLREIVKLPCSHDIRYKLINPVVELYRES